MAKAIADRRAARECFAKRLRRGNHGTRAGPSTLNGAMAVIAFIILSSLISGSYLPRASAQASSNSQKTFIGAFQYKSIQPICALGTCGVFDFSGTFMVTINLTSGLGPLPPQQTGAGSGTITDSGMCVGQGTASYTFGVTGDYFPNQGLSVEFDAPATPSIISWTDTCTDSTGRVYQQPQDTLIIPVVPLGAMFTNSTKVEGDCTQCFGVPPVHYVITANSQTSDSPLEAINLNVDSPTEGITHSGLIVGAFRDTDASDTGSGFSATIDWGDHSTTSGGSIIPTSSQGSYNVTGTHQYKEAGKFSISVTVNDPDGSETTLTNQVTVQDADLKAKDNFAFSASPGVEFNGTTAVFFDSNPSAPASDFSITINWGDGTKSSGVAVRAGGSPSQAVFNITGAHTYSSPGTYPVEGMIVDKDSSIETANSTAYVGSSPPSTTSTASSQQGGGGGIPEFPYQALVASVFTALIAASYILVRRHPRTTP